MNLFNINSSEIEEKYADLAHQSEPAPLLATIFAVLAVLAFIGNVALLVYIIAHKLYHNFISSHFIAHLCCTNLVALTLLLPIFIYTVWTGQNLFEHSHVLCRVQVSQSNKSKTYSAGKFNKTIKEERDIFSTSRLFPIYSSYSGISWIVSLNIMIKIARNDYPLVYFRILSFSPQCAVKFSWKLLHLPHFLRHSGMLCILFLSITKSTFILARHSMIYWNCEADKWKTSN